MRVFLLALLFLCCRTALAQPDSVRVFIDSALHIMQRHSMYAKTVDWETVQDSVHLLSQSATMYREAAPAVKYAFNQLGDKHGWLVLDDVDYHNPAFPPDTGRLTPAMKEAARHFGGKVFSRRFQKYAYLNIPFFGGQTATKMNVFAQQIQDTLCRVATPGTKGLILDLRLNGGGNLFPMLVGVSHVLGNGVVTQSRSGDGSITNRTTIENYSMTLLDTIVVKLQNTCGDFETMPVAVLIGPMTGSSGEALAIAFTTRRRTILIGERTAGFTTGNNGFLLPGSNNGIVIGEDFMTDKNGKEYRNGVQPAKEVIGGDAYDAPAEDAKLKAALQWLKQQ